MSCGNPHAVDCREVLAEVYLYLDGELAASGCSKIRQHLDECAPCLRAFGLEQVVKAMVARSCGGDPMPVGMRERVMFRLQEVRLGVDRVEFRPE